MADELQIAVAARKTTGKGAARQLRRQGWVPGSLYGPSVSRTVQVRRSELERLLKVPGARTRLVRLVVQDGQPAGESYSVLIKEVQRDPVALDPLHVDFYAVPMDRPVRATVPVLLEGVETLERRGLVPAVGEREVEVECLPTAIPRYFTVDVAALEDGDSLTVADLQVPEGVQVLTDPETILVSAVATREQAGETAAPAATPAEPERITRARKAAEEEEEAQ
ncbi:MAG: 50S ribosomal protein L25 [Firmicutes bacterium]|uniref:Large ribosomal subunit protein bL25 n=1 Tax=Geochorda subterranea TaxID=3109564 RepID=A0ABZ1BRC9_9FIRM|nr:50S ribosomal protein L25 [Limnochorda sp. LNt]NLG69068.1 50S ribosomal protein L25 [Bacillota bacterium]WRP14758.1 50S ribosomal protein L25 [Limnochorda sp. LNt]